MNFEFILNIKSRIIYLSLEGNMSLLRQKSMAPAIMRSSDLTIEKPTIKTVTKPVTKLIDNQVVKPTVKTVTKPMTKKILKKPTIKTVAKTITKPIDNQVVKPTIKTVIKKPTIKTITKTITKTESNPIDNPVIETVAKTITKTESKPVIIGMAPIKEDQSEWDALFSAVNSGEPLFISDPIQQRMDNIEDKSAVPTSYTDISLDSDQKFKTDIRNTLCVCGNQLFIEGNILICKECGLESQSSSNITEEEYSTSAITDCNVNYNGFIAMKMIGKGSYGYQRALLKTCADYSKYRKINTLKDMNNWNNNNIKKHHIPKNVIQEANDMFAKIKEHGYVFRKDGKKGVLSACLYYACYNNGISKTPSEIAQFSGIDERFHSLGDRILHDLNERGVIEIPIKINPIADYVDRYIELLEIPKKYRTFVLDLIIRAEKKRIHILHDSKGNTKASGAIYMLVCRVPELRKKITKEMIEAQCGISKTTFVRYYTTLCNYYKRIKKVFKRHGISMPIEWRDETTSDVDE